MKKLLIISLAAIILLSGCLGTNTVKKGDKISVDYTGTLEDGTVFDTSIESVAVDNNIYTAGRQYKPLQFIVGNGDEVQGFEEGVIGMKAGDSKTLIIPPEMGYGMVNPEFINTYPIIDTVPTKLPRITVMPFEQFAGMFGEEHEVGDIVTVPGVNISLTVKELSPNVSLSFNFEVGEKLPSQGMPWNETVVAIDETNITVEYDVKKNDVIKFPNTEWNTTVIDVTPEIITIEHNRIPDTEIQTMFGPINIHFNETAIIIDQNHKLAGKTLIFNVILKSINR